jgi:hypothetical protein
MRGAIPPLPLYVYMAWCLVKHRDNFTFTLPLQISTVPGIQKDACAINNTVSMYCYGILIPYYDLHIREVTACTVTNQN